MRVLHILDHSIPLQSGYTFRSRAIFREQNALGWDTFHLTGPKQGIHRGGDQFEETVDGLRFFRTPPTRGLSSCLPVINQVAVIRSLQARLRDVIDEVDPDILHAHSPALNGVATIRVGRQLKIPTVYELRGFWEDAAVSHGTSRENGLRYLLTRNMEGWVLQQANAVTCICQGIRKDLITRGIPQKKITIIPNAVDTGTFQALEERDSTLESHLRLENRPVIGFVGSFYAYEGLSLLLDALSLVLKVVPDIRLVLVGGGQEAERLKASAKILGLEPHVIFTGRVAHDQVARYYSLIDILCYPRLPMRLTEMVTPLKPLEAMAQRKPIIASNVGGHRELIKDGTTGVLFRAGEADDLAAKIIWMFENRGEWSSLRESARRFVEEERTWEKSVAGYKPVYEMLLKRSL